MSHRHEQLAKIIALDEIFRTHSGEVNSSGELRWKNVCEPLDRSYQIMDVWTEGNESSPVEFDQSGDEYEFFLVLQGEAKVNEEVLGPMSFHRVRAELPHKLQFSPNTRMLTIAVPATKEYSLEPKG